MSNNLSSKIGTWEFILLTQEVLWSKEAFEIFGRDLEYGQPQLFEVHHSIHYADRFQWELAMNQVSLTGQKVDFVVRVLKEDRSVAWVQITAEGNYSQGSLFSIRGLFRDITEEKMGELT